MASEKDFELLDEYVSNRLKGQEKTAFEQKLQGDADLNKEYLFQKKIAEGLRSARTVELKNMLNKVPLSSIPKEGSSVAVQVGVWIVAAALVGTGLYFYFNQEASAPPAVTQELQEQQPTPQKAEPAVTEKAKTEDQVTAVPPAREGQQKSDTPKPVIVEKPNDKGVEPAVEKPSLDVFDPSEEQESSANATLDGNKTKVSRNPSIIVETQLDKKYNFHYQFKDSKLYLYGAFEKNLYEIMEFFADNKRTMFLYYKDNYYLLNEENEKVRALTPIADGELLKKLRDYRGK